MTDQDHWVSESEFAEFTRWKNAGGEPVIAPTSDEALVSLRESGDEERYERARTNALQAALDRDDHQEFTRISEQHGPIGAPEPEPVTVAPEVDDDFDRESALRAALDSGDMKEFERISNQYPATTPAE